jgi:hypothetical protein
MLLICDNCFLIAEVVAVVVVVVVVVVNIVKFVVHQIVLHHPEGATTEEEGKISNVIDE